METFEVTYHPEVVKSDLPAIDTRWQYEILRAVEHKIMIRPHVFGKTLRQSLKGLRSLRVGNYRVVFEIHKKEVRIIAIVHRSTNYKGIEKRM